MEAPPPHRSVRFTEATSNFGWIGAFWAFAAQVAGTAMRNRRKVFTGAFSATHYSSYSSPQKMLHATAGYEEAVLVTPALDSVLKMIDIGLSVWFCVEFAWKAAWS